MKMMIWYLVCLLIHSGSHCAHALTPDIQSADVGSSVNLECNSASVFKWYFKPATSKSNTQYEPITGYDNKTLRLTGVTTEQAGWYKCAKNDERNLLKIIKLYITNKCVNVSWRLGDDKLFECSRQYGESEVTRWYVNGKLRSENDDKKNVGGTGCMSNEAFDFGKKNYNLRVLSLTTCDVGWYNCTEGWDNITLSCYHLPRTGCPPGFTYEPMAKGCYKAMLSNLDWPIAALNCRSQHKDAHLVYINDADEQNYVNKFIRTIPAWACNQKYGLGVGWWTGGHQSAKYARSFVWRSLEHGQCSAEDAMIKYANWQAGQPDFWPVTADIPMCICLFSEFVGWNDCPCTDTFCSLCEFDLKP